MKLWQPKHPVWYRHNDDSKIGKKISFTEALDKGTRLEALRRKKPLSKDEYIEYENTYDELKEAGY